MVERTIGEESGRYYNIIRGIVTNIDTAYMKVYWFHNGVTELYLHRMMKDVFKVIS